MSGRFVTFCPCFACLRWIAQHPCEGWDGKGEFPLAPAPMQLYGQCLQDIADGLPLELRDSSTIWRLLESGVGKHDVMEMWLRLTPEDRESVIRAVHEGLVDLHGIFKAREL
ncbi:hypothetical protein [Thiocapsa sp. N5-Cardenillas]|uniref:hypothetical protein n=1 Tax=Thiocapsa sp. N5-Cardenillas TaxID=3137397 RepID=UPI0035B34FDF